jgi:hypothetical protein
MAEIDELDNEQVRDEIVKVIPPSKWAHLTRLEEQLGERNWVDWLQRLESALRVLKVWPYVIGEITRPDPAIYPKSMECWGNNNELAKALVLRNLDQLQLQHIDQNKTASQIWCRLVSLHQGSCFRTALTYMRTLYHMMVKEDENIPDFIN